MKTIMIKLADQQFENLERLSQEKGKAITDLISRAVEVDYPAKTKNFP